MKRREFINNAAIISAAAFMPADLLGKEAVERNKKNFPNVLEPVKNNGILKEYELFIDIARHEIAPGFDIHTLAFNNSVPGPEIRVNRGDNVRVIFRNKTELNHTIHWHGMHVPWRMDGVPYVNQMPVMPGQTFVYEFTAEPYGTHFYHCHWGTLLHMQSGMFGSLIVEEPDDPIKKRFPYEREYTLIYSAHDTNFIREELNNMIVRMKERSYLMMNGRFDKERFNLFDSKDELTEHMQKGYKPPYVLNRRSSANLPQPNFFTVNGKSYPSTPNLYIKEGENIRVRLINAGGEEHYLHLHGHDFWLVADDGLPVPQPWQMNTIRLSPGKTFDIIIEGKNRGIWTFHDHDTRRVTNNGLYPGGNLLALVYEDLPVEERMVDSMKGMQMKTEKMNLLPKVALDE
ncbi:multicopper oxidase family protein [Melioribacter sp. Ez-97]|uniref:multicopper oxidase family protein n=1 Tax=Melioribacter sp. Ez-97 TaxID=3423434 RepID=UPI003ED96136